MMSPNLPAVLQKPHGNSLSMERALNQIHALLCEQFKHEWQLETADDRGHQDKIAASLEDVETMLASIVRE